MSMIKDKSILPLRTSDTAMAAYLMSSGFGSPTIEVENGKAWFLFSRDNPQIEKFITDWDSAQATGNILAFFTAYQSLLRRIRELLYG